MSRFSKLFKKATRFGVPGLIKKVFPGTGRHAAKRAEKATESAIAESQAERLLIDEKTRKEKEKAHRLRVRGIRSKRSAGYAGQSSSGESPSYGRPTIG